MFLIVVDRHALENGPNPGDFSYCGTSKIAFAMGKLALCRLIFRGLDSSFGALVSMPGDLEIDGTTRFFLPNCCSAGILSA